MSQSLHYPLINNLKLICFSEYMLSITLILNVVVLIFLHMKRKHYPANLIILIIFVSIQDLKIKFPDLTF